MTLSESLAWIRSKGREFRGLEVRILDGMHAAAVYTGAQPPGSASHAAGEALVDAMGVTLRAHQAVLNRWDLLTPDVPGGLGGVPARFVRTPGLGVVPILAPAIAAAVIALAISMAIIFRRLTAEEFRRTP